MEASHKTNRPHIKVGKYEEKKKIEIDSRVSGWATRACTHAHTDACTHTVDKQMTSCLGVSVLEFECMLTIKSI